MCALQDFRTGKNSKLSQKSLATVQLINLQSGVDLPNKDESGKETNRSCQNHEGVGHDAHPAKVQERRPETVDAKGCTEVKDAVQEQVETRRSRNEEGAPPPMIIFITELKVYHDDGYLGARDGQDYQN